MVIVLLMFQSEIVQSTVDDDFLLPMEHLREFFQPILRL